MDVETGQCACGARLMGDPFLEPLEPKPMLGAAMASALCALVSILSLWAKPWLVLAVVAMVLGIRAERSGRRDPARHGGRGMAFAGISLGSAILLIAGGYAIAGIPRAIERYRESQAAATRAEMHHLTALVFAYKQRFGTFPARIGDLGKLDSSGGSTDRRDAWEHKILYSAFTGEIAAAGGATAINQNFEIRSLGPDSVPGTPDDIIMRDGVIVGAQGTGAPSPATLPVDVPLTNRSR